MEQRLVILNEIKSLHREVVANGDCVSLKQLAVNGKDLIELGATPGKQLGEILEQLLQKVLDAPELNRKEILLSLAKQHIV
jgi:tRNA nucleotidyltransferase (CCA-adding enzyme)